MMFRLGLLLGLVFASFTASPAQADGRIYYIPSGSMEPTLRINDRIWASPVPYRKAGPKRGDIALMELPFALIMPGSGDGSGSTTYVKRIVAVPGDRVEMVGRVLKVNGRAQKEPFVSWINKPDPDPIMDIPLRYDMKVLHGLVFSRQYQEDGLPSLWARNNLVVPEKDQEFISRAPTEPLPPRKYLVLGDHRSNSNDSHFFGLIDRSQFIAKVTARLYPDPRTF